MANRELRAWFESANVGCHFTDGKLKNALEVCEDQCIETIEELRQMHTSAANDNEALYRAGFKAPVVTKIIAVFDGETEGTIQNPIRADEDNPLPHVLDTPVSPLPSAIDRLRSALSPRSRGAGTYSPVPRPTKADKDEDSGVPLQAAKVLDSPPEPQNEAIERDEFEKSNEKYAKFKMYEYVSSVRSMSMAQKSSIVLARMFRSV